MADLICGKHQYNGLFIKEPCPVCVMEEETGKTDADEIKRLRALVKDYVEACDLIGSGVYDWERVLEELRVRALEVKGE